MCARKFVMNNYDFIYIPAVQIQTNFQRIPSVHLNFMTYYRKRFGLGIGYKSLDGFAAMIHYRIYNNLILGFSYDFPHSKLRQATGFNSTEVMFGFHSAMAPRHLTITVSR